MDKLPLFPVEALELPDEELGIYMLSWWVAYLANTRGIQPEEVTSEMVENIRTLSLDMDTDSEDVISLEKALRLAASGEVVRAGKIFRDRQSNRAINLAAMDEAITGRRKQTERARRPRLDSLSSLILEILTENPEMSSDKILRTLRGYERGDVIDEIDEGSIWLVGRGKPVPISGLKDRVSRMRKKLNSR
jgi:hypothetical protein